MATTLEWDTTVTLMANTTKVSGLITRWKATARCFGTLRASRNAKSTEACGVIIREQDKELNTGTPESVKSLYTLQSGTKLRINSKEPSNKLATMK